MEFQERVGDGAQDGAAVQVEAAEADDAGGDAPVHGKFPAEEGAVIGRDALDAAQQVHGDDRVAGEDVGLVEDTPVDALVPGETACPGDLVRGETAGRRSVRPDERDVRIGVDPQVLEGEGGVETGVELVLVHHLGLQDHALLVETARRQERVHDVLLREHAGTAPEAFIVLARGNRELVRPFLVVTQHELGGAAPFPQLVLETVAAESGETHFLAEFLGRMTADLHADTLRAVEGQGTLPRAVANADVRVLQIAGREHVPQGGKPFEGTPFLEALHGGEDGLFPVREGIRPDFRPPGFRLVWRLSHFHLVAACHFLHARERTRLVGGVLHVAVDLHGDDGHPVIEMGRDVQEQLLVVEEPGAVVAPGIIAVDGQVPHPVDIGGG